MTAITPADEIRKIIERHSSLIYVATPPLPDAELRRIALELAKQKSRPGVKARGHPAAVCRK